MNNLGYFAHRRIRATFARRAAYFTASAKRRTRAQDGLRQVASDVAVDAMDKAKRNAVANIRRNVNEVNVAGAARGGYSRLRKRIVARLVVGNSKRKKHSGTLPLRAQSLRALCAAWLSPLVCALCVSLASVSTASATDTVRVGVLKFGTVNWELDVVTRNGFDRKHGFKIEVIPFANKQATPIAFFNGSIDLFVSDWLWASRARADGKKISFIPYSKALGGVIVPPNSKARALNELAGMRFGVAGGTYDKSWLLLQAWAQRESQFDAAQQLDVKYAAPPLLNGQIQKDNLDAVLNFWHYCARLESKGYRRLVDMGEVLQGLGIRNTPMVGYLFKEDWARANGDIVERFNRAVREARSLLLTSDDEWQRLRPLMKASDDKMFLALRDGFRKGVPMQWGREDEAAARRLTELFHEIGGKTLTKTKALSAGVFWSSAYF